MATKRTPEEWEAELHDTVEALARRVVLEETDGWEETGGPGKDRGAGEVVAALRAIAESARKAGFADTAETADGLAESLAGAGSAADHGAGIQRLQEVLTGESPPAAPEAAEPEPATGLGQDPELLADFVIESREHLGNIENQLLELEQDPGKHDSLHSAFRGFHTIKGLAGFLELDAIQKVAHEVETVLDLARNGQLTISPAVIDVVLAGADYLKAAVGNVDAGLQGKAPAQLPDHADLIARVRASAAESAPRSEPEPAGGEEPATENDAAGEAPVQSPPAAKPEADPPQPSAPERPAPAERAKTPAGGGPVAQAVKVDTSKLDHLVDMVGELVVAQSLLGHDPDMGGIQSPRLQRNLSQLSRITTDVQRTAMSMRMVPVGSLFKRMARLVRDLSRKEGKRVELVTSGDDTELDRNIVEELADPLMHMIRNAIGHGLEPPDQRQAAGKAATGTLKLSAFHQSGFIMIELEDDGRGLSQKKILAKAVERGLVNKSADLTEQEVQNLIFEPGFSTAEQVNDVSGRGVGMDVVKRNIVKLRGRVEIRSIEGRGTTFSLKVPLTLAIIEGLIVGVGDQHYIVPIYTVREMLRPKGDAMSTLQNRDEMVMVRGSLLPVVRLYKRFGIVPRTEDPTESLLLVTENLGRRFCLMVDDLIGKQEVVIKSLGETLKNVPGVAGGAILGDGHVGLILDMDGLFGAGVNG